MKTVMSFFRFLLPVPDMNRKRMSWPNRLLLILLIGLIALAGCVMGSQEPVGETPASINPQEWEGTWVTSDREVYTRVLQSFNPSQGILIMKTKRALSAQVRRTCSLPVGGRLAPQSFPGGGRIENLATGDRRRVLLLWVPNPKKIAALIKQGLLPGRLEGEKGKEWPILGPLLPHHYQVMKDHEQEIFFKGNKPIVLVRLAKQ